MSGDTSAGGLRRLDWALQGNVKVLVLALGANDGLRGLSRRDEEQPDPDHRAGPRAQRAWSSWPGWKRRRTTAPEYATAFRQAFREIAQKERVTFIPFLLDKVAGQPALNQADGIHPNAQGAADRRRHGVERAAAGARSDRPTS